MLGSVLTGARKVGDGKKKFVNKLTSGGDCPGLNAAIRGVGKAANSLDIQVIGYLDGFRTGEPLDLRWILSRLSGILSLGGTILGTSRDKLPRCRAGELGTIDICLFAVANYAYQISRLPGLLPWGWGTAKNARRLMKEASKCHHAAQDD